MSLRASLLKLTSVLSIPFLFGPPLSNPVFAFASVGTTAGVNLGDLTLDGSNTNEGSAFMPFSQSSVSGFDTTATSSADVRDLELKTFAQSGEESEDIFNGGSTAIFDTDYELEGIPKSKAIQIPLSFNVRLSGSLIAKSELFDRDSGAIASVIYDFIHNSYRFEGSATANSAAGSPAVLVSSGGFLGTAGNVDWERESLTKYSVNQLISLPALTDGFGGGFLRASLLSSSLADDGFAESNFQNTFALESISIGEGFDTTGLDDLAVVFEAGKRVEVDLLGALSSDLDSDPDLGNDPDNNILPIQSVPEQTSIPAIALSAIVIFAFLSKRRHVTRIENRLQLLRNQAIN